MLHHLRQRGSWVKKDISRNEEALVLIGERIEWVEEQLKNLPGNKTDHHFSKARLER